MPPHFGIKLKKKKNKTTGGFNWFETTVNGGAVVLSVIRDAATAASVPCLKSAACTTLAIIQITQNVKDNKAEFRRLGEDAAALTAAVIQSYQKSEDPAGWPGEQLKGVIEDLVQTLDSIASFAQSQTERNRLIRVVNSTADAIKIRDYRERLAQAMTRFELSAHLQSYEVLRLVKNMMEEYGNQLKEQMSVDSQRPLPPVPSYTSLEDEEQQKQLERDELLAKALEAVETEEQENEDEEAQRRVALERQNLERQTWEQQTWELREQEREANEREEKERKEQLEAKERETKELNEKLQQILRMLEERGVPEQPSNVKPKANIENDDDDDDSSSEDEKILKMMMADAAAKRADRAAHRSQRDEMLSGQMGGLNLNSGYPSQNQHWQRGRPGRRPPGRPAGSTVLTNANSGNITSVMRSNMNNDNSTRTRIVKRLAD